MIYQPDFADQARAMCRLGATDEELAEHFGVCVRTIYRWRNSHEAFAEAVVAGKDHADARVERALYARAIGCTVQRTRVFRHAGDTDPVYATYTEQLPPDTSAALHWLRARQPQKWRLRDEPEEEDGLSIRIMEAFERVENQHRAEEEAAATPAAPAPESPEPVPAAPVSSEPVLAEPCPAEPAPAEPAPAPPDPPAPLPPAPLPPAPQPPEPPPPPVPPSPARPSPARPSNTDAGKSRFMPVPLQRVRQGYG